MVHQLGVINLLFLKYDYMFIFFFKGMELGAIAAIVCITVIVLAIVIGNICCLCFGKPICCLVFIAWLWTIINPCNLCKKNKKGSKGKYCTFHSLS